MKKIQHSFEAFETGCYTAFFDAIDEMIFIKDDELRYVFANHALLDFFKRKNSAFLGKKDSDLMDASHAKACENSDKIALQEQKTVMHYETIGERIYQTRKFPFQFKNGKKGLGGIIFDVTRQHKTLESLKLEKERIEVILEASQIGLWDWDIGTDVVTWDAKCFEMLGYAPEAFPLNYDAWVRLMHQDNVKVAQEEVRRQMEAGGTFSVQFQLRKIDGTYAWIEGRGRVVEQKEDGTPKRMVGIHINKTEEKEKDEHIAFQHRLFAEFMDNSRALIIMKDLFGRYEFVNLMWEEMTGLDAQFVIGKTDQEIFPETVAMRFMENDAQVLLKGELIEVEEYLDMPDGRHFFDSVKFPLKDEKGAISGVCAMITEITERKEAEAKIIESEQRLATIIQGTNTGTWEWNIQTGEAIFNSRWAEIVGYSLEELAPLSIETWTHLAHPEDRALSKSRLDAHMCGQSDYYEVEARMRHKDGSWVWVLDRGRVFKRDSHGKPLWMSGTHQDITARKKAEENLLNLSKRFEKMFENNAAGIFVEDEARNIVMINERFTTIIQYTKEELYGKNALFLHVNEESYRQFLLNFIHAKEGEQTKIECRLRQKDGTIIWCELLGNKIDIDEERNGVIWSVVDITDRKKVYQELEIATIRANELAVQAELANVTKSQFLANMSHEIRTPMNAIIGLSELMKDTILSPKQEKYLEKISASSRMLLGIINDILDFSKIEAGKIELENSPVSLEALITHIRSLFEDSASKKGVAFNVVQHPEVPSVVVTDELRLSQILTNFLSNALKFTEKGSVTLGLSLVDKADSKARIRFEVSDTGVGMTEEQVAKLFMPFSQADASTTRKYGGTGLGLSIAKRLAEIMGAYVHVQSEEGKGSTFSLELEFDVVSWERVAINKPQSDGQTAHNLEGISVLVVEDNTINQEIAKALLERKGIRVDLASNGKEGVTYFTTKGSAYDCILMDIQMPIMGGYEATEQIRKLSKTIPIIALTAAASSEDKARAIAAGMNDHLAKPIEPKKLYAILEKYCFAITSGSMQEPEALLSSKYEEEEVLSQEHIQLVFGENQALHVKLLEQFKVQLESEFATLVEDVKLCKSDVASLIHALKGVSSNLGAMRLSLVCKEIDACYKQQRGVSSELISRLDTALREIKTHLNTLCVEDSVTVLEEGELIPLLQTLRKRLEESELIELGEQLPLVKALEGKVDTHALTLWSKAIDAMDYGHAVEIMNQWELG